MRVVIAGRFPYLFTNFSTYAKTEQWVMRGKDKARKTLQETLICIAASTIASSSIITAIECPKIMDQMAGSGKTGKRTTVLDVVRKHGVMRVLRGYDATFCREFLFNWALLGAPVALLLLLANNQIIIIVAIIPRSQLIHKSNTIIV